MHDILFHSETLNLPTGTFFSIKHSLVDIHGVIVSSFVDTFAGEFAEILLLVVHAVCFRGEGRHLCALKFHLEKSGLPFIVSLVFEGVRSRQPLILERLGRFSRNDADVQCLGIAIERLELGQSRVDGERRANDRRGGEECSSVHRSSFHVDVR